MNVVRRKPAHRDARGVILDILENDAVECVTILTSKRGAVRANHYHKKTTQYTYVIDGKIRVLEQRGNGRIERRVLKPGDLLTTPPWVKHAVVAIEDSTLIACAHGPRRGKNYEDDTYRLDPPLWPPRKRSRG
jgi:quercetin dioxygenase-like cupin family protein